MSEDKQEWKYQTADVEEPHAAGERGSAERAGQSMSLVPILGVVAILLLAMWVGMGLLPGSPGSADEDQLRAMKAEVSAMEAELNAQRLAMGLRPKESTYESVEVVAERMKKDADTMVALAQTFQRAISEKEALLSAKNSEMIQSEQTRQILLGELEKARQQLGSSLAAGTMGEGMKVENETLKAQRDGLSAEVARLREELAANRGGGAGDQVAQWERRLEEAGRARDFLEARVKELEGQLSQVRLFARSENELLPVAVNLFRSLRVLENKTEEEMDAEYSRIGIELGANVLHMLSFETGASELSPADQERIRALVADVPDGDLVLCVGYASETGDVDENATLSSARATAAAELFAQVKRPGQLVQAVYLGQTDRFGTGSPERNQLVEIWRIRKK